MKRILDFARNHERLLIIAAFVLIAVLAYQGLQAAGRFANEYRINKLETEKQQALKERDEARANDLILQGKLQAKDELINQLTSQIAESNQKVMNAHNETQTAKATLTKVRVDPAKFNAADDAGRVQELSTELRGLYPDPKK